MANWDDPKFGPYYGESFADDVPKWGDTYLRGMTSVELGYQLFLTNIEVPLAAETTQRLTAAAWSLVEGGHQGGVSALRGGPETFVKAPSAAARAAVRSALEEVRAQMSARLAEPGMRGKRVAEAPVEDRWRLYVKALDAFLDPHHFREIRTPSGGYETIGNYRIDRCKPRWRQPLEGLREAAPNAAAGGPVPVGEWSVGDQSLGVSGSQSLVTMRPHEGAQAADRRFVDLQVETGSFETKIDALIVRWSCVKRLGWFHPAVIPLFANGPWLPNGPFGKGGATLWGANGILRLLPLFLGTCRRPRVFLSPAKEADFAPLARAVERHGVSVGPFSYSAKSVAPDATGNKITLTPSKDEFVVTVVSSEMPFTGD